ncbi:MAG: ATP-binding protein [Brevinematia bacterium]
MKKFSILVKPVEEDIIETDGVWLSISEAKRGYNFFSQSNPCELLFVIYKGNGFIKFNDPNMREVYESYKSSQLKATILYIDSKSREINFHTDGSPFILIFRREKKEVERLSKDNKIQFNEEDIIIGFDSEFDYQKADKLSEYVFNSKSFANLFLKEFLDFLVSNQISVRPLFVINFTEHKLFKFFMESNMKALTTTIDMLKNKILKYNTEKLWQIETVLHEAFMNAVTHGNELEPKRKVEILYEIGRRGIRIIVKDMGKGFDVNNLFVPSGEEALNAISGRGIYLMEKLSDILFYSPEGNKTLIFFNF